MASKILVVGGLGYLGSVITDLLVDAKRDSSIHVHDVCLWGNNDVRKNTRFAVFFNKLNYSATKYETVVWCADVDIPEFYAAKSKFIEDFLKETLDNLKGLNCPNIVYCLPLIKAENPSRVGEISEYNKKIIEIMEDKKARFIRFPTMYGPSPRMRWDTIANQMIFDFLTQKAVILNDLFNRVGLISVFDAANYVVEMVNSKNIDLHNLMIQTEIYSTIELATLIKQSMPNSQELLIHVNSFRSKDWKTNNIIKDCGTADGKMTVERAVKDMISQFEKNMFPDFTEDRYNNELCVHNMINGLSLIEGIKA